MAKELNLNRWFVGIILNFKCLMVAKGSNTIVRVFSLIEENSKIKIA